MPVANNYRLTQKDTRLLTYFVAHDMAIFYVVQTQYADVAYTGNKYQIPAWIREGSAQLIGLLATNDLRNAGKSYVDLKEEDAFVGPKPESICSKDLQDAEGFEASTNKIRDLGFQGKLCIHPDQIPVVNKAFTPTEAQVARATKIVEAFAAAEAAGSSSIQLDGQFIDYPIVYAAQRIVAISQKLATAR
jgi:hypothetical protein